VKIEKNIGDNLQTIIPMKIFSPFGGLNYQLNVRNVDMKKKT
jgi:hypothetical protein